MKLKNFCKRFFTWNRHASAGFTLVELIVVIAILAILAGVGIPVYSGYITKANKQADHTLVSEVVSAMMLQYYADPANATAGYVILKNGADATADGAGIGAAAMEKTFGSNWAKTATLKSSDWTDEGMLDYVLANSENAGLIAGSTYLTKSTPAEMVSAIANVTDSLSAMVTSYGGGDPMTKVENLGVMSDAQIAAMRTELGTLGVSWSGEAGADNSAYATAVSNLMVKYVADEMGSYDMTDENAELSGLASVAGIYCTVYAWAANGDPDGQATLASMNNAIANGTSATEILEGLAVDLSDGSPLLTYMQGENYMEDTAALFAIMGAVSDISDDMSMKEKGLYSSASISGLVNNYTSAITAVAALSDADIAVLENLPEGAIAVFVNASGTVSVVPAEAYLAGK